MRNPDRMTLILEKLRIVWESYPDLRLAQLVWIAAKQGGMKGADVFNVEDTALERGLEAFGEDEIQAAVRVAKQATGEAE